LQLGVIVLSGSIALVVSKCGDTGTRCFEGLNRATL